MEVKNEVMVHGSNKKHSKKPSKKPGTIVSNKVLDYGKEPFFVKKTKESKAFLEKHGFPQDLLSKK